jgi:hypothetical protein
LKNVAGFFVIYNTNNLYLFKNMKLIKIAFGLMLFATSVGSLDATTVIYDFDSGTGSTAFSSDFASSGTSSYSPISLSTTGGINDSGMFNTRSGSGSQLWTTKAAYSSLSVGQSLSVSLYFKFSGTSSTSSLKIGLVDSATPVANSHGYPNVGSGYSFAYFSEIANLSNVNSVVPESYGSNAGSAANVISLGTGDAKTLTSGSWYYVSYSLTKTATDTFDVACQLSNSSASGVVGSSIASYSTTGYSNAGLDSTLHAFIGVEYPGSTNDFLAIDNLTLTSDSAITDSSVPEPSCYAFLAGAGVLVLSFAARRRRMELRACERR